MEIYSEFEWMKYDFIVHPGGNPNDIQINYEVNEVEISYLHESSSPTLRIQN